MNSAHWIHMASAGLAWAALITAVLGMALGDSRHPPITLSVALVLCLVNIALPVI